VCVCVFNCFWPFTGLLLALWLHSVSDTIQLLRERDRHRETQREREREFPKIMRWRPLRAPIWGLSPERDHSVVPMGKIQGLRFFFFFFFFFFLNVFLFCFSLIGFINYKSFKFFKHPIFFLFFFLSLLGRLPSLCPITEERLPLTNAIISYFGLITFLIPATEMDCNTFYADASKDRFDHHSVNDRWE
jgi:cellulose synthase/poly-beta-1,6-N-acetylglucosamine synthase-like glycosyltransferase